MGSAAEEEPNTRRNPTTLLGSREEPGAHGASPHTTRGVPHVPTCSWRGDFHVPHVCPVAVPAAQLLAHVPRRRATTSNVNARAGFLRRQVHESLSSGGGNLLPRVDHLRAGAAPAPPSRRGYLGRPRGGAAAASSCAAAEGTQEPATIAGPNPLASPSTRKAPWLAPHGRHPMASLPRL